MAITGASAKSIRRREEVGLLHFLSTTKKSLGVTTVCKLFIYSLFPDKMIVKFALMQDFQSSGSRHLCELMPKLVQFYMRFVRNAKMAKRVISHILSPRVRTWDYNTGFAIVKGPIGANFGVHCLSVVYVAL